MTAARFEDGRLPMTDIRARLAQAVELAKKATAEPSLEQRFWANVEKIPLESCWEWVGGRSSEGYGQIRANGKIEKAHRKRMRRTCRRLRDRDLA